MDSMLTEEQKEAMRQSAKEVVEDAKKVAKKAAKTAKPVTDKVTEAAKPVTEKVVKAAKPVADKVAKAVEPSVAAAKQAAKKAVMKPEVYVQYAGKEVLTADLVSDAKAAYRAAGYHAAVKSLKIYVKPEENTAYFVINEEFKGAIQL